MTILKRFSIFCFLLTFFSFSLKGQTTMWGEEGSVSFITSQNTYVKFTSTANIRTGDTLFIRQNDQAIPALVVKDLSSVSCVCVPLSDLKFNVSDKVYSIRVEGRKTIREQPVQSFVPVQLVPGSDSLKTGQVPEKKRLQQIHGYFNIASYTNLTNNSGAGSQRMKYTFSLLAKNIGDTKLSAECYIAFIHSNKNWDEIQSNLFNGLKIYNLNLSYDFSKTFSLLLGRKINPKLSNMGANDGLQFEMRFKPITVGIIAGFRPNYSDYGFNANLFQYGLYLFNQVNGKNGNMQSTLAYVEQMNDWKTDRRFLYLQHVNSLVKNLTFYGSAELDLYRMTFNTQDSSYSSNMTPRLTNLYLSLNWRVIKQLSLSFSYNNMQNVIYYQTYKSYLDKMQDPATLQGFGLQIVVRPVNKLSIGLNGAYRFEQNDPKNTKNVYGYITYSQIPGINISATASVNLIQTSFIGGAIYGLSLSRDFAKGKLYAGLGYRYVDYRYYGSEINTPQNVGEVSLTWRIYKRISFTVYYEGTFEKYNSYNRIYGQLNLGF
ncbi:MAG: hypothetical protein WCO93_05765 [bacterium]